jgi:RimJ/RimL family protein N-acetyltransferase
VTIIGAPSVLRDGSVVLIRQVRSTDAALLAGLFAGLSERSRMSRFLGSKPRLSRAELRFLTCVDHHDHEALAALDSQGRAVAVARYIRDREDRAAAEVAVTVADEWQGRGLGTRLLELLADRAHAEAIVAFTATVALGNRAADRMIRNVGGVLVGQGPDCCEYEICLAPWQEPFLLEWLRELDHGLPAAGPDLPAWGRRGYLSRRPPRPVTSRTPLSARPGPAGW